MTYDILKRSRRVSLTVAEITFLEQLLSKEVFDPGSMGTSLFGQFQHIIMEENDTEFQRIKDAYRGAVYTKDGEVESDCDAEVSIGDDCGHRFPTVELSAARFKAINDAAALVERFEKLRKEYR